MDIGEEDVEGEVPGGLILGLETFHILDLEVVVIMEEGKEEEQYSIGRKGIINLQGMELELRLGKKFLMRDQLFLEV